MLGKRNSFETKRPNRATLDARVYLRSLINVAVKELEIRGSLAQNFQQYLLHEANQHLDQVSDKYNRMEAGHFLSMLSKELPIRILKNMRNHPCLQYDRQRAFTVYNFWLKTHKRQEIIDAYNKFFIKHERKDRVDERFDYLPPKHKESLSGVYEDGAYDDSRYAKVELAKNIFMHAQASDSMQASDWMTLGDKEKAISSILTELSLEIFTYCIENDIDMDEFFKYPETSNEVEKERRIRSALGIDVEIGGSGDIRGKFESKNMFDLLQEGDGQSLGGDGSSGGNGSHEGSDLFNAVEEVSDKFRKFVDVAKDGNRNIGFGGSSGGRSSGGGGRSSGGGGRSSGFGGGGGGPAVVGADPSVGVGSSSGVLNYARVVRDGGKKSDSGGSSGGGGGGSGSGGSGGGGGGSYEIKETKRGRKKTQILFNY